MKVTRELASKVRDAIDRASGMLVDLEDVTAALKAALADVPEPFGTVITYDPKSPPSAEFPFRLDEWEKEAMGRHCTDHVDSARVIGILQGAVNRAVRTLAAPQVEQLSAEEERALTRIEATFPKCTPCFPDGSPVPVEQRGNSEVLAAILRKRFPKPVKTLGQVAWEARNDDRWEGQSRELREAYEVMGAAVQAELLRRAEGK